MHSSEYNTNRNDIKTVTLAGNPNVGKSTVFNALTGMHQHTGNWTGKTVDSAVGYFSTKENRICLKDIPGTYSLNSHSIDESIARDILFFEKSDATIVVCDATCLERNLSFVLSVKEINPKVIVCINLLDEAERKNIKIDLELLSKMLNATVVGTVARSKKSLDKLSEALDNTLKSQADTCPALYYGNTAEEAINITEKAVESIMGENYQNRFTAINLLCQNKEFISSFFKNTGIDLRENHTIKKAVSKSLQYLSQNAVCDIADTIIREKTKKAESLHNKCVTYGNEKYSKKDRILDKLFTGKFTAFPIMLILLCLVFWLTLKGANYPSAFLSELSLKAESLLIEAANHLKLPNFITGILINGSFKVLAWVISVMLPPMAIFFPLFSLLEDFGYLPRIAFNLDKPFIKCNACGKQALCMCMGFGCNAVGVTGCRIIDSKRERLLAVITNSFVPCNGKFPFLITVLSAFFISDTLSDSFITVLILTAVILFGVLLTFIFTKLLSSTILKGEASSFTLELPPYRRPQIGKVLVRSLFDRTLHVLYRAIIVAAPSGAVIWLLGNITLNGESIIAILSGFLDPFAKFIGLDGVILIAFILGLPANEIVLPLILMMYTGAGMLSSDFSAAAIKEILISNEWNTVTALCTAVFSLLHWPCSTTLLTIHKETSSLKWTLISAIVPTVTGVLFCFIIKNISLFF